MAFTKSDSPYPFAHLGGQDYGISQRLSYVPHPSFYSLEEQYNSAITSAKAIKETFVPKDNRLLSCRCPPDQPPLNTFEWAPDKTKNLARPKRGMNPQFVCPADYKELLVQEEIASENRVAHLTSSDSPV